MFDAIHYAEVGNGARLAYCDSGGPASQTLLLLHGIFDHKRTWSPLAARLSGVRCVAPDLLGHGHSDRPPLTHLPPERRYAPDMQAEYLCAFVEAMGLESFALGGSSLGGGIALRLYLDYPEVRRRTRALVLVAAAGYPQPLPGYIREMGGWLGSALQQPLVHALCQKTGLLARGAQRSVARCFHDTSAVPPALVADALAALQRIDTFYAYQLSARNIVPPDIDQLAHRLGEVGVPTVVFWGREDRIINPLNALRFSEDIAGAQVHLFDHCGHAPHIECAGEMAPIVHSFITQNAAKG